MSDCCEEKAEPRGLSVIRELKEKDQKAYDTVREIVAKATGEPVEKIGDGTILNWLVTNGPTIMSFITKLIAALSV